MSKVLKKVLQKVGKSLVVTKFHVKSVTLGSGSGKWDVVSQAQPAFRLH